MAYHLETSSYSQNTTVDEQPLFSSSTSADSDSQYHQLKQATLQLWKDKHQKLDNPCPPTLTFIKLCEPTIPLASMFLFLRPVSTSCGEA